jgi:hypothetical protein
MIRYKEIMVAKGSDLWEALHMKSGTPQDASDRKKQVEKVYKETSDNYKRMFSQEDRDWFAEMSLTK